MCAGEESSKPEHRNAPWQPDGGIPLARALTRDVAGVDSFAPVRRKPGPWFGLIGFMVCFGVFGATQFGAAFALGVERSLEHVGEITAIGEIVAMGILPVLLVLVARRSLRDELHIARPVSVLVVAIVPVLLIWPITSQMLTQYVATSFPPDTERHEVLVHLVQWNSFATFLRVTLIVAVVPAVCEELLFRGFLLASLRRWLGTTAAVVLNGVLFAGVHVVLMVAVEPLAALGMMIPLTFLGIALAMLTAATGTIVYSALLHFANNFTALLQSNLAPPDAAPEGTIPGAVMAVALALAVASLAIWMWLARRRIQARPMCVA